VSSNNKKVRAEQVSRKKNVQYAYFLITSSCCRGDFNGGIFVPGIF
jgi:hypothetical protein